MLPGTGGAVAMTSCGVAFAHGEADYDGHYGTQELCNICPEQQLKLCRDAWVRPSLAEVVEEARALGAGDTLRSMNAPSSWRDWTNRRAITSSTATDTSATTARSPTTTVSTAALPSAGRRGRERQHHEHQPLAPSPAGTITIVGRTVSGLGFSTMRLAGPGTWGFPANCQHAVKVLRDAVHIHGITHIDTADAAR